MSSIRADTIGGFNTFLEDQRDEPGEATVSLYDFNSQIKEVYQADPIAEAKELDKSTFVPSEQTALYDAITMAITRTDEYLSQATLTGVPENVIVVVLTDGEENASETPQEHVRELVKEFREEREWEFLFIGANQDAALTAESMGMDRDRSLDMSHTGDGTRSAYESTSESVSRARREGNTGGFDANDHRRQEDADDS